jgi:hypothetical protein
LMGLLRTAQRYERLDRLNGCRARCPKDTVGAEKHVLRYRRKI